MAVREFNPVNYPSALMFPARLTAVVDWHGHIPFAFSLVDMLRPKTYVELGVYYGDSYCAVLQAMKRWNIEGMQAWGIDTYEGDEDTGHYGSEIYDNLSAYHKTKYSGFSSLVKSTFDDAVGSFAPESVDLLHHDGLHTYEALWHDFETWKPKLSDRAVMIIHDIELIHHRFGVRKWWHEVREQYPWFEFNHSCGLGVLGVGKNLDDEVRALFDAQHEPLGDYIRNFYSLLGDHVDMMTQWQFLQTRKEEAGADK